MEILGKILLTLAIVAANALVVIAEFAAVAARTSRLSTLPAQNMGVRGALMVKRRLDLYLSSCQLGITLTSLALGAVADPVVSQIVGPIAKLLAIPNEWTHTISFVISFVVVVALHIVVGEQAPKNWAIRSPDRLLVHVSIPLILFTYICYPAIWALNFAANWVLRASGVKVSHDAEGGHEHSEEELRALLSRAIQAGTISAANEKLLTGALDFNELKVRQIMTPRTKVEFLTLKMPLGKMLRSIQSNNFTRLPLCDGDLDHIVGLIHMKDLFTALKLVPGKLRFMDEKTPDGELIAIPSGLPGSAVHVIGSGEIDLKEIRRDILFVPELLPLPKLLRQFQTSQIHMAVVVDEYGATLGIVTFEDVIEQIVGEIEDEFDTETKADFLKEGESFRIKGDFALHELRERLNLLDIEFGEVDTLSGYITQELKRLPRTGDVVTMGNYTVRVLSAQDNRVLQAFVSPTTQKTARDDGPGQA